MVFGNNSQKVKGYYIAKKGYFEAAWSFNVITYWLSLAIIKYLLKKTIQSIEVIKSEFLLIEILLNIF